ncbi:putative tetratricopeptide-like helical domain superfamily, DYW domain-containing protein [Helianthus debilis subsp. tardiflorus]
MGRYTFKNFFENLKFNTAGRKNCTGRGPVRPPLSSSPAIVDQLQLSMLPKGLNFYISMLQSCISINQLRQLHAQILKTHLSHNLFLLTRVAHTYLKFGYPTVGQTFITTIIKNPPLFLYNETIKCYAKRGCYRESIDLYYHMVGKGYKPNAFTFTFVLPACAGLKSVTDGRRVHDDVMLFGCECNEFVATALIDFYGKCGELGVARQVFDEMPVKKTASFNALMAGMVLDEKFDGVLLLFNEMNKMGIEADAMTMVSVLQSCAHLGALQQGRWAHEHVIRARMGVNVYLGAALINMYARCGSIDEARQVFDKMPQRDIVTWTAIICGYGMHGLAHLSEYLFVQMVSSGLKPDAVTFVGVLAGFSHNGMVEKGWYYFNKMSNEFGVKPALEHYSCMVDMLGRAGRLKEAEELIRNMYVQPDSKIWGGLLNACKIHKNYKMAERVVPEILKLDPTNAGWHVLMSNIYATSRKWDQVAKTRRNMKEKKLEKSPGWSSIEVAGQIHTFLAFDQSHDLSKEIYEYLKDVKQKMRAEGYVPELDVVFEKVDDRKTKEEILFYHSERLAIAFGILSTANGDVLRVMKNLRVCVDCHNVIKFISRIACREMIVRDVKRFHHFKDGVCSCGDFW